MSVESRERCACIADVHARLARDLFGVRARMEEASSALEEVILILAQECSTNWEIAKLSFGNLASRLSFDGIGGCR